MPIHFSPKSMTQPMVQQQLSGLSAFYKNPNYIKNTQADFSESQALPTAYSWKSDENRCLALTKRILCIIIFPIGIAQLVHAVAHRLAGLVFMPSCMENGLYATEARKNIFLGEDSDSWKYLRTSIDVEGVGKVDIMLVGKQNTFSNRRWVVAANGNSELYEKKCYNRTGFFFDLVNQLDANAILFNYPGVGSSQGIGSSAKAAAIAHRAVLEFLEDKKVGVGAQEIIGYGMSIGGGVQGEALKTHKLKNEPHYVFVKDRTFSNMASTAEDFVGFAKPLIRFLTKAIGWNIGSERSSAKLDAPEIILQHANVSKPTQLTSCKDKEKILGDRIISQTSSHAYNLLGKGLRENQTVFGIPETHNDPIDNIQFLVNAINEELNSQKPILAQTA